MKEQSYWKISLHNEFREGRLTGFIFCSCNLGQVILMSQEPDCQNS